MEQIDLIKNLIMGGFGITFGLLTLIWYRIEHVENKLGGKIEKLDEKLTDVDRRLCRLEGAFSSKDCCMIKDERQIKKAE